MGILSSINEGFALKENLKKMKLEKTGKPLIVDIKKSKEPHPTLEGIEDKFIPLELTFFNENSFAVIVTGISLIDNKGGKIIIGDYNPEFEIIEIDPSSMFCFDDLTIPPNFEEEGTFKIGIEGKKSIIEDNPIFLISRDTPKGQLSQIELEITYQSTKNKGHELKIIALSQPIKITG